MLTMSMRSILFRAVYKLSTAEKMHEGEKQEDKEKVEGKGAQGKQ